MATIKIKGLNKVKKTVLFKIGRMVRLSGILNRIAKKTIKEIQEGKSVKDRRNKLTPLANSTIKRRKRLATVNVTDSNYKPSKSNLTFTGQLVRSIKAKIIASKNIIVIQPTGTRRAYKGIRKKKLKMSVKTNLELARIHAEGKGNLPERNILFFSKAKEKQILKELKKAYKKEFK